MKEGGKEKGIRSVDVAELLLSFSSRQRMDAEAHGKQALRGYWMISWTMDDDDDDDSARIACIQDMYVYTRDNTPHPSGFSFSPSPRFSSVATLLSRSQDISILPYLVYLCIYVSMYVSTSVNPGNEKQSINTSAVLTNRIHILLIHSFIHSFLRTWRAHLIRYDMKR